MVNERAHIDFGADDNDVMEIDLSTIVAASRKSEKKTTTNQQAMLQKVAEDSGFTSREPQRSRRHKRRSPYAIQTNLKTRLGMKELMQDLSDQLGCYDQETFELALEALMEKHQMTDLLRKFRHLCKDR